MCKLFVLDRNSLDNIVQKKNGLRNNYTKNVNTNVKLIRSPNLLPGNISEQVDMQLKSINLWYSLTVC